MGDKCNICQNRVYLLERHIEGGKLYHRSCYRHSELSPTNKVYTRSPFLSPSLSKETPPLSPSSHVKTSSSNSEHQHQHQHRTPGSHHHHNVGGGGGGGSGGGGGFTPSSKAGGETTATKSNQLSLVSSDIPRKTDSAGSKHSLAQPDREDTKKSKLQSISSNSEGQNQKASAIKDRLKNLKEKYEVTKKADDLPPEGKRSEHKSSLLKEKESHSEQFPLSGKESRQLEKRREQILSAEKRAEQSSRAGARNVPLIFQQKDSDSNTQSTSASSVLSNAKQSSTPSSSSNLHSSTLASSSSSTISYTPTSSKSSVILNTEPTQRKTARKVVKAELVSKKEVEVSDNKKSLQDKSKQEKEQSQMNKKNLLDVKENEKADIGRLQQKFSKTDEAGSTNSAHHPVAKARTQKPLDLSKNDSHEIPIPVLRKTEGSNATTPKAAPRKSRIDTTANKAQQEKLKHPQVTSGNLHKETPPHSARSLGSESPPPLPFTPPPPLPTSPPPSLPPSAVIKVDGTSPQNKAKSPTSESFLTESVAKSVNPSISNEKVSTHGPVKSRVAVSSQVVATTSNKRYSSPAIHDPPLALLVTPQVKDKEEQEVRYGLLASLAGVRSRASSVPGIPSLPLVTTSEPTPSQVSSADLSSSSTASSHLPPSSTPAKYLSSKTTVSHGDSSRKENSGISVSVVPKTIVPQNPKAASKVSNLHKKDTNGPQSHTLSGATVPEALNVLNNLKKVGDSKSSQPTDSISKTVIGSTKIEINVQNKQPKKNSLSASKEDLNETSTKSSSFGNKQKESHEHITDSNFKTVKLKHVGQPDSKPNVKPVSTLAFDIQLKKVENNLEDKKTKSHQISTTPSASLETSHNSDISKSKGEASSKHDLDKVRTDPDQSSVVKVQARGSKPLNLYEEDELPDWKAALEERKKKLREDATKSESSTMNVNQPAEKSTVKENTKPGKILIPSKDEKNSTRSENDQADFQKKSLTERATDLNQLNISDAKKGKTPANESTNLDKKSPTSSQHQGKATSVDWKQDAEMKIAALGGFDIDSEKEEKEATKPKRILPKLPDTMSVTKSESKAIDKPQSKLDTQKGEKEKIAFKEQSGDGKDKENTKESGPEFLTGKSKLKHVKLNEGNNQVLIKKNKLAPAPPTEKKETEDFRERLQNLKRVQGGEEIVSENENQTPELPALSSGKTTKPTQQNAQPTSKFLNLTKPLPLVGDSKNTNTNNNQSKNVKDQTGLVKANKKSLMDSINLTSSPDVSDEEGHNRGKTFSAQKHSTPIMENGKTSPKTKKKKIPFFGKNKKVLRICSCNF